MTTPLPRPEPLEQLLRDDAARFERVPADPQQARRVLERIAEEELLAVMLQSWQAHHAGIDALHRTAHTSAYDAARKAVDAVLLAMGVRTTRAAGHHGTAVAAQAALPPPPPSRERNTRAFAQARFVRHEDEYPRPASAASVTLRERRFQTQNCVRLVIDCQRLLGLAPTDELLPTDERLDVWRPPFQR